MLSARLLNFPGPTFPGNPYTYEMPFPGPGGTCRKSLAHICIQPRCKHATLQLRDECMKTANVFSVLLHFPPFFCVFLCVFTAFLLYFTASIFSASERRIDLQLVSRHFQTGWVHTYSSSYPYLLRKQTFCDASASNPTENVTQTHTFDHLSEKNDCFADFPCFKSENDHF